MAPTPGLRLPRSVARRPEPGTPPWLAATAFAAGAGTAAGVGGLATARSVDSDWFDRLAKPSWYPPAEAFGPVWTVLYVLMTLAAYLAWRAGASPAALAAWWAQMALNLGWSVLFFGLRLPRWALAEIVVLSAAVAVTAIRFRPASRLAAGLLAPYLLWVVFATALNAAIVAENR